MRKPGMTAKFLSLLYLATVVYLTFFISRRKGEHDYRSKLNLHPFQFIDTLISIISHHQRILTQFFISFFGNIILFMPLPAVIYFLSGKIVNFKLGLLFVLGATLIVELLQYTLDLGVFDVDDIFLNFLGGIIGLIAFDSKVKNK